MRLLFLSTILIAYGGYVDVEAAEVILKPKNGKIYVSGKISFEGPAPDSFPAGSWLFVELQDTTLADAAAVDLGKFQTEIKDYHKVNHPLMYEMEVPVPNDPQTKDFSLTAHISLGGKRSNIKEQDYITTTIHSLDFVENQFTYTGKDIEVVKYD